MLAKKIPNQNPDYRSDYKMIFRPIERLIFRIKHILHKHNNTSLASLKTALPKDLEVHSQKLLLSLVPRMATILLRSFPQHQLSEQGH